MCPATDTDTHCGDMFWLVASLMAVCHRTVLRHCIRYLILLRWISSLSPIWISTSRQLVLSTCQLHLVIEHFQRPLHRRGLHWQRLPEHSQRIWHFDASWKHCCSHTALYEHTDTAEQQTIIQQYGDWYTGHWWVGCCIWYSKEGPGRAGAPPSPSLLYQMQQPTHQWPVYQLHIIQFGTVIAAAL